MICLRSDSGMILLVCKALNCHLNCFLSYIPFRSSGLLNISEPKPTVRSHFHCSPHQRNSPTSTFVQLCVLYKCRFILLIGCIFCIMKWDKPQQPSLDLKTTSLVSEGASRTRQERLDSGGEAWENLSLIESTDSVIYVGERRKRRKEGKNLHQN